MNLTDILSYRKHLPTALTRFLIGFLLMVGFCLQNAKLIPGLPGEYQPLIFFAGCCLAILAWPTPPAARIAALGLLGGLTLSVLAHYFFVEPKLPTLSNLLRLAVGPVMLAGVAAAWERIDHRWLWSIFVASLLFAAVGSINSSTTTNLVGALGVRINDTGTAYAPWAAFFFSEYSYAALAFAAAFAWLNARAELTNHQRIALLTITTLLIGFTRSGTGFALISIILMSQLRPKYWIICLGALCAAFFLSPRVERLVNGLMHIASGGIEQFIAIDPGSSWRFLSNYLALQVEFLNPLGTLSLDMNPYRTQLPLYGLHTQQLIDSFLLQTTPTPAQGVFFNYGLFGGVILQACLCFALVIALTKTSRFPKNQAVVLLLLTFYAFFVQSGLASPGPWILLGIFLSPPKKC